MPTVTTNLTTNQRLLDWVSEMAAMTTPDQVVWCDEIGRAHV